LHASGVVKMICSSNGGPKYMIGGNRASRVRIAASTVQVPTPIVSRLLSERCRAEEIHCVSCNFFHVRRLRCVIDANDERVSLHLSTRRSLLVSSPDDEPRK